MQIFNNKLRCGDDDDDDGLSFIIYSFTGWICYKTLENKSINFSHNCELKKSETLIVVITGSSILEKHLSTKLQKNENIY